MLNSESFVLSEHVKKKQEEFNIKLRKMYRLSELSLHKLVLYRQDLKPVWTYGIQVWGCVKQNNTEIIQRFQNKVLQIIVSAPWYVRNNDLHRDLKVHTVTNEIKCLLKATNNGCNSLLKRKCPGCSITPSYLDDLNGPCLFTFVSNINNWERQWVNLDLYPY